MQSTRTETRAVGCGRLSQGQTMRAEGRHVPHMSPFTVELILTAVHCLLIGRPRAPSSPTAREMPRGVAVASIARLPSSTDDPRASGSTADRHSPSAAWCLPTDPALAWGARWGVGRTHVAYPKKPAVEV